MSHPDASIKLIASGKVNFDSPDFISLSSCDDITSPSQKPNAADKDLLPSSESKRSLAASLSLPLPHYPPSTSSASDNELSRPESVASFSLCFSTIATKDGIAGKRPGHLLDNMYGPDLQGSLFPGPGNSNTSEVSSPVDSRASLVGPLALQQRVDSRPNASTTSLASIRTTNAECDGDGANCRPVLPQYMQASPLSLKEKMRLLGPGMCAAARDQ